MSPFQTALAGALAGVTHVLLAPDHVAAVAPFSVEARRAAWRVGLRWGIGDAAGIAVMGAAARALAELFDLELWSWLGERFVGLVLMAIGGWGLWHLRRAHPAPAHVEPHLHTTAAFLLGIVHGAAGTGSLLAVTPVLTIESSAGAAGYLAAFALGAISAMIGVAALVGLAAAGADPVRSRAFRGIFGAASSAALVIGLVWLLR